MSNGLGPLMLMALLFVYWGRIDYRALGGLHPFRKLT